jgi:hypothetical protein
MKKKFRKVKELRDEKIAEHANGIIKKIQRKFRIKTRIAAANRWAERHKAKTLGWTVGLLMLSLVIGATLSIISIVRNDSGGNTDELQLSSIADVKPMFGGFQRIQKAKDLQADQMQGMITKGKNLKGELDSLVALPYKTHKDSVNIVIKYHQLEYIVKSIENK